MNIPLPLVPPLLMVLFACGTLLIDVLTREAKARVRFVVVFSALAQAFIGFSLYTQWQVLSTGQTFAAVMNNSVLLDHAGLFSNVLVWISTLILLLISYRYLSFEQEQRGEFYALALFAQCGMYFMATSVDLVPLFIGIEITSLSFYILTGFTRANRFANEAALKYLLLGSLASGFVLYGFSILYGLAGDTSLTDVRKAVDSHPANDPMLILATVTLTAGLLFKVSAVPFHSWTPDAYDGAPTPVTAHLSIASKIASFTVLVRVLLFTMANARPIWQPMLIAVGIASMTLGCVAALTQTRLKRLLAYSSIAHAGYVLLALITQTQNSLQAVYFYLLVYALMNGGTFALITSLRRKGIAGDQIEDLRGLSRRHPVHAALFVVLLLSLAGLPPTAGFLAKYFIFLALIQSGHIAVAAIAAGYIVFSLYFYFRLVREMYLLEGHSTEPVASSVGVRLSLVTTTVLTLALGILPEQILRLGVGLADGGR